LGHQQGPCLSNAGPSGTQNGSSALAQAAAEEGIFDDELSDDDDDEVDVDYNELDALEARLAEATVK
jgi:hypothetical protein